MAEPREIVADAYQQAFPGRSREEALEFADAHPVTIAAVKAALALRQRPVPVPYEYGVGGLKVTPCLSFDGGSLTIYQQGFGDRDGDGYFCFAEDELEFDQDDESGKLYRTAKVHNSDLIFLRDRLCRLFPKESLDG